MLPPTAPTSIETASHSLTGLSDKNLTSGAAECLHLTVIWSRDEPERVGECCAVTRPGVLGRSPESEPGDPPKLEFARVRPGASVPTGTLKSQTLSRRQWQVSSTGSSLKLENLGKRALIVNSHRAESCSVKAGDTVGVEGVVSFLVESRPRLFDKFPYDEFEFGSVDSDGIVGESHLAWSLRQDIERTAKGSSHVLMLGESGTGKELTARAIHRASRLARKTLVCRNAATIPEALVEAELFGNAANYPNPGTPGRKGLFGQVDGGILFLDEVGELAERQQANLLRVLDSGEYQRLGEDTSRTSAVRVLAATNRDPGELKHDVLARFPERLAMPSLNERRSDIALVAEHLLRGQTDRGPSQALIEALTRHSYTLHVRELERLLLLAQRSTGQTRLPLTSEIEAELKLPTLSVEPTRAEVELALAETSSAAEAASRLGLPSRFALYRLLKRLGIER